MLTTEKSPLSPRPETFENLEQIVMFSPLGAVDFRRVRGSPVVFVNGKGIDGVSSLQMLTKYVDEPLQTQTASVAPSFRIE